MHLAITPLRRNARKRPTHPDTAQSKPHLAARARHASETLLVSPPSPPRVPAMAHGGYPRRGAAVRRPKSSASAGVADRKRKRPATAKTASLKNQVRSTERFLRKVLA